MDKLAAVFVFLSAIDSALGVELPYVFSNRKLPIRYGVSGDKWDRNQFVTRSTADIVDVRSPAMVG